MAQATDPHSSFTYLIDNLPSWKSSIDVLADYTISKNAEFVAEYARLVNQVRIKRTKTASISSIRSQEEPTDSHPLSPADDDAHPSSPRDELNPLEAGNRYIYAQARRKRKPETSVRSGASGPQKFRTKNQVMVFYDGHLQTQLDNLVKSIGVARNNLRKGKTALVAAKGFQLPPISTRAGQGLVLLDDVRSNLISRSTPALLASKKPTIIEGQRVPDEETSFVQVDKQLEAIQSLCETAAHQFLRDGDCKTELDTIRQKFSSLLDQATATAESLKKFKADEEPAKFNADRLLSDLSTQLPCSALESSLSCQPSLNLLQPPKLIAPGPLLPHPLDPESRGGFLSAPDILVDGQQNGLLPASIEVDDNTDDESIVLDLSQYRLTNPRRVRI